MTSTPPIQTHYPHTTPSKPLICAAPMRLITTAPLASAVSLAGGLGFLGAGSDASTLDSMLSECADTLSSQTFRTGYSFDRRKDALPIGVGFLLWGIDDKDFENVVLPLLERYRPVALWLFTPRGTLSGSDEDRKAWLQQMRLWTSRSRERIPSMKIWLQVGSVLETKIALEDEVTGPCIDVLVAQGSDAGGHGLVHSAGLISLVPEVADAVKQICEKQKRMVPHIIATGGISTGAQVASTLVLGAHGVCLGTRFLASPEANLATGYRNEVVRASDGGQSTVRSGVYDYLRGTRAWPPGIGGRGVVNVTYREWNQQKLGPAAGSGVHAIAKDAVGSETQKGRDELERQYKQAEQQAQVREEGVWGPQGRMTTYAGTGVGMVKTVKPAAEIVTEVQEDCQEAFNRLARISGKL